MRIANMLHFTENHRYYILRNFSLSTLDYRMLGSIYQPMIGPAAISLFSLLYHQVSADRVGYSGLEQQRKLFLSMDIELSEKGRKYFAELASKLEAIGLLQTTRRYMPEDDDYVYSYELVQPLLPDEFFRNEHLVLLLRDKIGKFMVVSYREQLHAPAPQEIIADAMPAEDISTPFYDLFSLNTSTVDHELEQALLEVAPAVLTVIPRIAVVEGFHYSDIITRFPRESYNRKYVENLKFDQHQMSAVNYFAKKYSLSLQETCRLLDEDGIFNQAGELVVERFQHKANLYYRQDKQREEQRDRHLHKMVEWNPSVEESPSLEEKSVDEVYYLEVPALFKGQCDIIQYNLMLRNEPYTRVLKRFFPGSVPDSLLNIFEKVDLNYKLKEEVINVLIHYLKVYNLSWNKPFIDSVVTEMLGKHVETYEQAVQYIRDRNQAIDKKSASKISGDRGRGKQQQKPKIPIIANKAVDKPISDEDFERILNKAKKLDEARK